VAWACCIGKAFRIAHFGCHLALFPKDGNPPDTVQMLLEVGFPFFFDFNFRFTFGFGAFGTA